jgi:site-specific recombinase XerD
MKNEQTIKLRKILNGLPPFLSEYFRGIAETKSANTRYVYSLDLRLFFTYLIENKKSFGPKGVLGLEVQDLDLITVEDIEAYIEYLTYYTKTNRFGAKQGFTNASSGKGRKLAAIKNMYRYFYRKQKIKHNPAELVDMPKINEKNITVLEKSEVSRLISEVETGVNLTKDEKRYFNHVKHRDLAIIALLLGTGIRVSECAGINKADIDFNARAIKITRKGGDESVIYYTQEVAEILGQYNMLRDKVEPLKGHEGAFFLSIQNRRITTRAIQNLVKKYTRGLSFYKNISPHKFRSTFGTNLYKETGDIYLVADILGHKDINTTKKHYARMDEERRKSAADFVKLRGG